MPINLLPDALAEAQRERKRRRVAMFASLAVLFLSFILSVGAFAYRSMLDSQKRQLEKTITLKREELSDLQDLEHTVVDISKRAQILNFHFKNYKNYSVLMEKLLDSQVTGVQLTDISLLMNNRLNVVGSVQTYDSLSTFLDELLEPSLKERKQIFISIDLQRVTSDPSTGKREFDLQLEPNIDVF